MIVDGINYELRPNTKTARVIGMYDRTLPFVRIAKEVNGFTVTEIKYDSFSHAPFLEVIELPSTISVIGGHAFAYAEKLKEVYAAGQTLEIHDTAFLYCEKLQYFSNAVVYLNGRDIFNGCKPLKFLDVKFIKQIPQRSFAGCEQLQELSFDNELDCIASDAFENCHDLKKLYFEGRDGIKKIPDLSVFAGRTIVTDTTSPLVELAYNGIDVEVVTDLGRRLF